MRKKNNKMVVLNSTIAIIALNLNEWQLKTGIITLDSVNRPKKGAQLVAVS